MTMVGADTAELRKLASEMRTAATRLGEKRTSLNSLIDSAAWSGADRNNFANLWARELGPSLKSASDRLDEVSRSLDRNATEQDQASNSDGGAMATIMELGESIAAAAVEAWSRLPGDLGGTYSWEERGEWAAAAGSPQAAGAEVISRALRDTADQAKVAPDEFEIVKLDNGKYLVIMPGVTDFSKMAEYPIESGKALLHGKLPGRPPIGYDPVHRSVRDTDQAALGSTGSSSVEDNLYAQYVVESMKEYKVPPGSDIVLIGHSFGADTAIDLAADSSFNGGADGYHVSHVMAAGYHNEPLLDRVPSDTNVLAIQNGNDRVVQLERGTEGAKRTADGIIDIVGGTVRVDGDRVGTGVVHVASGTYETVTDTGKTVIDFGKDTIGRFEWTNPFAGVDDAVDNAISTSPSTVVTSNGHVNIVFDGGGDGVGHHPSNYAEYVVTTDSAEVAEFNASLAEAGYTDSGIATAHDVSVPE